MKKFRRADIEAKRGKGKDVVFIIDNMVYDVTTFLDDHPGGHEILVENCGKDASECFHDIGHSNDAIEWRKKFLIGEIVDEEKVEVIKKEVLTVDTDETTFSSILNAWMPPLGLAFLATLVYMYLF